MGLPPQEKEGDQKDHDTQKQKQKSSSFTAADGSPHAQNNVDSSTSDDDDDDDDDSSSSTLDDSSNDEETSNDNVANIIDTYAQRQQHEQEQEENSSEDEEKQITTEYGISMVSMVGMDGLSMASYGSSVTGYGNKGMEELIDDCMVICLGISKYDENVAKDINDINGDIEHYENTFKRKYGYKFIKNDISERWTKDDVRQFLYRCREKLIDDHYNLQYNGLIVCISGHGTQQSLICSDGESYQLSEIRALFSQTYNQKFINLPKIFIIDACRDFYDREQDENNNGNVQKRDIPTISAKNYSLTICATSEGNSVWGGLLSESITNAFNQHIAINNNLPFNHILDTAKKALSNETNKKQELTLTECDMDVLNKVFFLKHKNKKLQIRGSAANQQQPTNEELHGLKPKSSRKRKRITLSRRRRSNQ